MENFFNWMAQPVPKDEIITWFNIHNMSYEKIELYGDVVRGLYEIINDTYLGNDNLETKIILSDEDNKSHFEWCWRLLLDNFKKENILLKTEGKHKDYLKSFFLDTYYSPNQKDIRVAIPNFLDDIFSVDTQFSKSDLDILTEIYGLMEKNIE